MKKVLSLTLIIVMLLGISLPSLAINEEFSIAAELSKSNYDIGEEVNITGQILKDGQIYTNSYSDVYIKIFKEGNDNAVGVGQPNTGNTGIFNHKHKVTEVGNYKVVLSFSGCQDLELSFTVSTISVVSATLNLDKDTYTIGEDSSVKISGTVLNGGQPLDKRDVIIGIFLKGSNNPEFTKQILTDSNGNYETQFNISSTLEKGEYVVKVSIPSGQLNLEKGFVLDKEENPGSGDTGGGNSGGGNPGGNTGGESEDDSVAAYDQDGNKQPEVEIKEDSEQVTINADTGVAVNMPSNIVSKASKDGKKLAVNTGDAVIEIAPGAISVEDDTRVELRVNKLEGNEASSITDNKDSDDYNEASEVFDFDLVQIKNNTETKLNFNKPLTITVKYNKNKVSNYKKVGIYYYNEDTSKWEYVGGTPKEDGSIVFDAKHFSKYAAMEYNKTFVDTNNWAKQYVETVASRHIINGMSESEYKPEDNITRAQFAKLLVVTLGLEKGDKQVNFVDVQSGWYKEYVEIVASLEIVNGYPGNIFMPNKQITRQEMAKMLVAAIKQAYPDKEYVLGEASFIDNASIANWAQEYVSFAFNNGLITGFQDESFRPNENATRAQAAVVIYRILNLIGKL